MYQEEINRAVTTYPDKWWAAEELRDELYHYWITTSRKISNGLDPSPRHSEYAYMDEDEADIHRAIHSPTDDSSDFYARKKEKERHADFARRADADGLLQACFWGWAYSRPIDDWIEASDWDYRGRAWTISPNDRHEDSCEQYECLSKASKIIQNMADDKCDCVEVIKKLCELMKDYDKLEEDDRMRFLAKILFKQSEVERSKRKEEEQRLAAEKKKKEAQKKSEVKMPFDFNEDELPF